MIGGKTTSLRKWCKDFYDYRSSLVHGDVEWELDKKAIFRLKEGKIQEHHFIAHKVFFQCLKAKLFLMGLFPEFYVGEFKFDELF